MISDVPGARSGWIHAGRGTYSWPRVPNTRMPSSRASRMPHEIVARMSPGSRSRPVAYSSTPAADSRAIPLTSTGSTTSTPSAACATSRASDVQ